MSPASPINIDYLLISYLLRTCSKKHVLPTYEEFFDLLIILKGRATACKLSKVNYNLINIFTGSLSWNSHHQCHIILLLCCSMNIMIFDLHGCGGC